MLTHGFLSVEELETAKKKLTETGAIKLNRKASGLTYSFLRHSETNSVYALSRNKLAYKGGQSQHVKILYDETGSACIAKVAVFTNIATPYDLPEVQILNNLNRLHSVILRPLERPQPFKTHEGTDNERIINIHYKLYLIQTQIPGINLFDWLSIPENRTLLSSYPEIQYQIALKLIARLNQLHLKSIVHGDIKPANIVIKIDDNEEVHLEFVDFGNSAYLTENHKETSLQYQGGTPRYRAPELETQQPEGYILGYAGDIYSLCVLFQNNLYLPLPSKSFAIFLKKDRLERASLAQLATCIFEEIATYAALHPLSNPTLKELLKYFKNISLNKAHLHEPLRIFKNESQKEEAVLADILLNPSEKTIKRAMHFFKISKNKSILSFRQTHMEQEYRNCLSLLTKWQSYHHLESFIDSMKSRQKLLKAQDPFCQFYSKLLGIIRHVQGIALLEQLNLCYPELNPPKKHILFKR